MIRIQALRAAIERLMAATEEVTELFGRIITEYELELSRQQELLFTVINSQGAVIPPLLRREEDAPAQREWRPSLMSPRIKEEEEEVSISPERSGSASGDAQQPVMENEAMGSETDGENCGGPEQNRNSNPESYLKPNNHGDWGETSESQSGLKLLRKSEEPSWNTEKTPVSSSECAKNVEHQKHGENQTEAKPFTCTVCDRKYTRRATLTAHMRTHSEGKGFGCSVCKKNFPFRAHLVTHTRTHTGEKPFSCSVCSKGFGEKGNLKQHMRTHTGEKPFSCSVCSKGFAQGGNLRDHMKIHTGCTADI